MPALARLGDPDIPHCSGMVRLGHVKTVFANGIPLSCQGHLNTTHVYPAKPFCLPHGRPIIKGSPNVFAEGLPVGRVGDPILQCTAVMKGSPNVFANGGGNAGGIEKFAKGKGLDTKNPNEMKNL